MNFKIVEGAYVDLNSIYDEFKCDYLYHPELYVQDLKQKYNLTHREFKEISDKIKKEFNLPRRPSIKQRNGKYYYNINGYFHIRKMYNGKLKYLGSFDNEEVVKKIVELCKKVEWDIDKCTHIIHNWREYIV